LTLIEIMSNEEISARRRIEACDSLLGYESPPEIAQLAKEFLTKPSRIVRSRFGDRLDALKLMRKFEAPKIALPTIRTKREETDRREAWRRYEIAQRKWKLVLAIHDVPPPGWADDLYSADYEAPPGWPPWG
jgi:hypothetical protein